MVWRGRAGGTPPLDNPKVATGALDRFSTPFFLGWHGEPAAQGSFTAEGNTLRELYERLFEEIPANYPPENASLLLLEILGTAHAGHIHDRALKKSVHEGDTLVTARPSEYFNFHIVQDDLERAGHPPKGSLVLAIVGAGYRPDGESATMQQFEQRVFYEPPRVDDAPVMSTDQVIGKIKTHSHMMAWPNASPADPPDFILHLDEWSRIAGGSLRVFAASPEMIEFVSA